MKKGTRVFTIHPRCDHIRCYPQFEEFPISHLNGEPRHAFLENDHNQLPAVNRKNRDFFFILLFISFTAFMVYTISNAIFWKKANLNVILHGYDSWGNICGQKNEKIRDVPQSGKDMSEHRFLLVAIESNISLRTFCVAQCPTHGYLLFLEISSLLMFKIFNYVRESVFNRCVPRHIVLKTVAVDTLNVTGSFLEEVMSDINVCWKEITYLCSISFVLALILLVLLRYIAGLVVWVTLITLSIVACTATTYVWYGFIKLLWHLHTIKTDGLPFDDPKRVSDQKLGEQWFIACLASTCTTVSTFIFQFHFYEMKYLLFSFISQNNGSIVSFQIVFLLLVIVMRRRIQLFTRVVNTKYNKVSILFKEAGKAISAIPFLLFQPILTTICIAAFCYAWLIAFLYLQSCKSPVIEPSTGLVTYTLDPIYKYLKWCHFFCLLWSCHFIIACQHFVIAGAVSKWFFRSESDLRSPILESISNLIRFHLGSIALGSLLVSSVKVVRFFFKKIETLLSRYKESCVTCGQCCRCCFWIIEKCVMFINKNAYIEIVIRSAINGESFCKSAQRAFQTLAQNALRVITVNSVGDFLLFLGKVSVVTATIFIGVELLKDKASSLHYSWSPLILCALFAYFVSHCFLAVYEMTIDTLLLCFCEDQTRGGVSRPHLVNSGLLTYFKASSKTARG
ncbi:choline transporter-like protein 1 [Leptotrombidium deliense]|uniref:Choline transporter-like protein n=1 Tax=Leptotrombidium deliense TaxID=299467 RepID=A0A443SEH5_9ACAR|nr:choline transporter-like protein 1 [Leptotrombidium deliense]